MHNTRTHKHALHAHPHTVVSDPGRRVCPEAQAKLQALPDCRVAVQLPIVTGEVGRGVTAQLSELRECERNHAGMADEGAIIGGGETDS